VTSKRIETGVDRLVALINAKKKVEVSQAAKQLGVGKTVVQEWSDFLEEQGLISVEYSLSKVYLVERKLSEKEVEKKRKEYSSKKDAFVRKMETTLQRLENESLGFEEMKKRFNELEKGIGTEIIKVKDEVDELKHYESLKKNMDEEILRQKLEYQKMFDDLHKQIQFEEKKYDKLLDGIETEKSKISQEQLDIDYMEKKEENLMRRIESLQELVKSLNKDVKSEKTVLDVDMKQLKDFYSDAEKLAKEVQRKKIEDLEPLVKKSEENKEKIMKIQDDLIKKIKEKKDDMEGFEGEGVRIADEFEKFFKKKANTDKLLDKIDDEKTDLQKEMNDLILSAKAFQLTTKSADVKKHISELENKFQKLENKRSNFKSDIEKLNSVVLGRKKGKKS